MERVQEKDLRQCQIVWKGFYAGCGIEFDKMSKVFDFSVNATNLKKFQTQFRILLASERLILLNLSGQVAQF